MVKDYPLNPNLMKQLHLLTRDGRLNSDAARKVKQVKHLVNFMEPGLEAVFAQHQDPVIVDFGAGKSYLGFFLYDLFVRKYAKGRVICVESRQELVDQASQIAKDCGFERMEFVCSTIENSLNLLPSEIHVATALHACDTATDDVLAMAVSRQVPKVYFVPCCQAELSQKMNTQKVEKSLLPLLRHPHHRREFMSHLTNVMRGLYLESCGYKVRESELVGWEHSLKNEIWICEKHQQSNSLAKRDLESLIEKFGVSPKLVKF